MAIDVGSPAVVGNAGAPDTWTYINLNNPANASGTITTVEVYMAACAPSALYIGIFYLVSGTTYRCRSAANVGNPASNQWQSFEVDLAIEAGDFIGWYSATDFMKMTTGTGAGDMYIAGNHCVVDDQASYSLLADRKLSLWGEGNGVEMENKSAGMAARMMEARAI